MSDQNWSWWEQALDNPADIGKSLTITTTPEAGFYRTRFKDNKPWLPVAIWLDNGEWLALRNGKSAHADDVWTYCCRNPVSAEAYERALAGNGWADDDLTVASMIGHNVGDVSDLDLLRDQIASAEEGADAYRGISTDEQAGRAQSLRARMNELAGIADKKREELKKPHFEAGKKIDAEWMPLVKQAKSIANWLREELQAFETLKLRERRAAEEERQRLERERLAEEERARAEARRAEEEGRPVVLPPEPAPPPPPLPPMEDKLRGNYGRAASIGVERVVTAITDQDALYQYLRDHSEMKACMLNLAQRAVKAGHTPPGVTIEERARVS